MRRTGIDLSATQCLVVDAERSGRRDSGSDDLIHIHNFASLPGAGADHDLLAAELSALIEREKFPRRAWVNLWGVRNVHEYLLMPLAPIPSLETKARVRAVSNLGVDAASAVVSMTLGSTRGDPSRPKRELCYFAAVADDVERRLRPVVDAGFVIEGVTTPCGALWSHARVRRPTLPGEVHAHVAIGVTTSSVAIFSDGFMLYGRDLALGFCTAYSGGLTALDRDELASRLAAELRWSFLFLKQYWEEDVSLILLCGGMPELRSLTAPLIERLNVEVETMDTLDGFDLMSTPEAFANQAALYRVASAIAVEPPPVNLMPDVRPAHAAPERTRVLVAACGAAVLVLAALLYAMFGGGAPTEESLSDTTATSGSIELPRQITTSPTPASPSPEALTARPATPPRAQGASVPPALRRQAPASTRGASAARAPVVSSILFSPDRRVALVDGRIVSVGDRVGSSIVLDIEPRAVVLASDEGRKERIEITPTVLP